MVEQNKGPDSDDQHEDKNKDLLHEGLEDQLLERFEEETITIFTDRFPDFENLWEVSECDGLEGREVKTWHKCNETGDFVQGEYIYVVKKSKDGDSRKDEASWKKDGRVISIKRGSGAVHIGRYLAGD